MCVVRYQVFLYLHRLMHPFKLLAHHIINHSLSHAPMVPYTYLHYCINSVVLSLCIYTPITVTSHHPLEYPGIWEP